jgi:hypothetical protein
MYWAVTFAGAVVHVCSVVEGGGAGGGGLQGLPKVPQAAPDGVVELPPPTVVHVVMVSLACSNEYCHASWSSCCTLA